MSAAEYRKLIVIVWLVVAVAMGALWGPKAWTGSSWDTDDFMRLVQVRDLLAGQAWSDLTQHRLNPPDGTLMHWARLPDVPIALVTLALTPLLGARDALVAAAMLVPPLYLLPFLAFFAVAARLMLGGARSPIALLVAIGGSISIVQFMPGRVDHHGLQLTAMMAAMMLLLAGVARRRWQQAIAWAGVPFALSVWIGAETLPLIAAWFAALGLAWCHVGGRLARQGAMAGLLGAAIGIVILVTSVPRPLWLSPACDAFSPVPIAMLALTGFGFAAMAMLGRWIATPAGRLGAAGVCGAAVAAAFAVAFPACAHGGLEMVDPVVKRHWLDLVAEATPLFSQFRTQPFEALMDIWTPALGLAYCLWRMRRAGRRGRTLWGAVLVPLLAATALMAWQVRAASFAQELALLPLAGLASELWARIRRREPRWMAYAMAPLLLFVTSLLFWPSVGAAYGALAARLPGAPRAGTMVTTACAANGALAPLQDAAPSVILSYIDIGSMILFDTPHSVLGAPYHRDNAGLHATIELFRSNDDAWIKGKLGELGVGWVVTCPGVEERSAFKTDGNDGLAERLAAGRVPDYLEPVPDPAEPGMKFYRVRAGE
ncbi:MAG TPA: hypothetical protein VLB05_07150 [Dongiaceae bacterium]|nr:hypothetical protein [Dongiaceae bacterium]